MEHSVLGQGRPRVPLGKQGSVDVCGEMNMLAQALGWSMALTSSLSYAMATSYCHSAESQACQHCDHPGDGSRP